MKKVLATLFTFPVLAASQVYADTSTTGLKIGTPIGVTEEIPDLVVRLLNYAVGSAAVICVAILIASGYMYITASGDEGKVEKATKSLTFAIIGLAICFIAVMLVNFVLSDILGSGVTA